jgi:beta-lactamase regulating signal transducer with metallopeptidase domain
MTPLQQALSQALLHFIWQGALVAIALRLVLTLLRNSSPNARYVAGCGALALLAVLPVITAALLYTPLTAEKDVLIPTAPTILTGITELAGVAGPQADSLLVSLKTWVLPAWMLGVALFALRLMWSWSHTRKLATTGTAPEESLLSTVSGVARRLAVARAVRVLMSPIADVPSVVGWLRPVLLLPAAALAGLTPQQLEAVLAHELAHIRRHDYLVNVFQNLVEALLFYHPAVWWTSARIRYERELCCDDLAVEVCGDPVCYARALTLLEKERILRPSLAMGSAGGPLLHRIRRILMADRREYNPWRLVCGSGLLAGIVCLAVSSTLARTEKQQPAPIRVEKIVVTESGGRGEPQPARPVQRAGTPLQSSPGAASRTGLQVALAVAQAPVKVESSTPSSSTRWVLFHNGSTLSNASPEDLDEAKRAIQSSGGGDLLWFRQDGKAWVTQDKTVLDPVVQLYEEAFKTGTATPNVTLEAGQRMNEAERRSQQDIIRLEFQRSQAQLQVAEAQLNAAKAEIARERAVNAGRLQPQINQRSQAQLQVAEAQLNAAKAEIVRERAVNAERLQPQINDALRNAVESGKAKPVQ